MKTEVKKFYDDNRELFEVVVAFFIISALFLSLQAPEGLAKNSFRLVQFFFLCGSCGGLGYLLKEAISFFVPAFLRGANPNTTPAQTSISAKEKESREIKEAKRVVAVGIALLVSGLLMLSVIFYLYLSYRTESTLLLIAILCYISCGEILSLMIKSLRPMRRSLTKATLAAFSITLLIILALGLPIALFLFVSFSVPFTWASMEVALLIALCVSLAVGTFLSYVLFKY
jgi:hypothetical protein